MPALDFSKWSPGGNTTLFFPAAGLDAARQAELARQAMRPDNLGAEQAGFVSVEERRLRMAGGEFCVNATRAFGALLAFRESASPEATLQGIARQKLGRCRMLVVCGNEISHSMSVEIGAAEKRNLICTTLDGLAKIDGIRCNRPNGAFYVFADISSFGLSSVEFCNRLLDEQKVVCIPGSAFGECGEGFIRIAYTCSDDELHEALKRISRFCSELRAA